MKKVEKRIWTRAELTIAYYIAKWDYNGLKVSEEDLIEAVIGDTTKRSLDMQVANFRYILGIEGYSLEHFSKAQDDVATSLQNKTITQVRRLIETIIRNSDAKISFQQNRRNNDKIEDVRKQLNTDEQNRFEAKMNAFSKYRRLTPVKK